MQVLETPNHKYFKINKDPHRTPEWGAYYGNNNDIEKGEMAGGGEAGVVNRGGV